MPHLLQESNWSLSMLVTLRLLPLQHGKGALIITLKRGDFPWIGQVLPNLTYGAGWRSSPKLSLSLPKLSNGGMLYLERHTYVCSCQASSRPKNYQKKCPGHQCKIESKKTSCTCQIMIKCYYYTQMILGQYAEEHDHDLGMENIAYTWLSHKDQDWIQSMLHQKVDPQEIVHIYSTIYFSSWSNPSID